MRFLAFAILAFMSAAASSAQASTVRVVASINVLSQPLQQIFAEEIAAGSWSSSR